MRVIAGQRKNFKRFFFTARRGAKILRSLRWLALHSVHNRPLFFLKPLITPAVFFKKATGWTAIMSLLFQLWIPYAYAMRPGGRGDKTMPLLAADFGDITGGRDGGGRGAVSPRGRPSHGAQGGFTGLLLPDETDPEFSAAADSPRRTLQDEVAADRSSSSQMEGDDSAFGSRSPSARRKASFLQRQRGRTRGISQVAPHVLAAVAGPAAKAGVHYMPLDDDQAGEGGDKGPPSKRMQPFDAIDMGAGETFPHIERMRRHLGPMPPGFVLTPDERRALNHVLGVEQGLLHQLRWRSMNHGLQRFLYMIGGMTQVDVGVPASLRNMMGLKGWYGNAYPVISQMAHRKVNTIRGFLKGFDDGVFTLIDYGLIAVKGYQILEYIEGVQQTACGYQKPHTTIAGILDFYWNDASDSKVMQAVFKDVLNMPFEWRLLILGMPVLYGALHAMVSAYTTKPQSKEKVERDLAHFATMQPSLYRDYIRWLFPFHPTWRRMHRLVDHYTRRADLTLRDQKRLLGVLKRLSTGFGYTSIEALHLLSHVVSGIHHKDTLAVLPPVGRADKPADAEREKKREQAWYRLGFKAEAALVLEEGTQQKGKSKVLLRVYNRYMRWALWLTEGLGEFLGWWGFKIGKSVYQMSFLYTLAYAFLKAYDCPKQPGVSLAGVKPWAKDLTKECFMAAVQAFNIIPGQPVETLVGNLDQYHFPTCEIELDLSNKGLDGNRLARIINALKEHGLIIRSVDASGNTIGDSEKGTAMFFESLYNVSSLDKLVLANNQMGYNGISVLIAMGNGLKHLRQLKKLDLSWNWIGLRGEYGTFSFSQGLSKLINLEVLNLSGNWIGYRGTNGTSSLGAAIRFLTGIKILDLSSTWIGKDGENGTISIAESINALNSLNILNFSRTFLGYTGENGILQLCAGIENNRQINVLDLSHTRVGYVGPYGSIKLSYALSKLKNLEKLFLYGTWIGYQDFFSIVTLSNVLRTLHSIKKFSIGGLGFLNKNATDMINNALIYTNSTPMSIGITTADEMLDYCEQLNLEDSQLNLSGKFQLFDSSLAYALLNCTEKFTKLEHLNLSNNPLGTQNDNGLAIFGQKLSRLKSLVSINLSRCFMGWNNLSAFYAVAEGISTLTNLEILDLSDNKIGNTGVNGSIFLGKALKNLVRLGVLQLSGNNIGSRGSQGIQSIAEGIGNLFNIWRLDLSKNWIGFRDVNESIAIGNALMGLLNLKYLDLSDNWNGHTGDSGIIFLGRALGNLKNLIELDMSKNAIGKHGYLGVEAIFDSLRRLNQLEKLNFLSNKMHNIPDSLKITIFKQFFENKKFAMKILDKKFILNFLSPIPWENLENELRPLYSLQSSRMAAACDANKCYGYGVSSSDVKPRSAATDTSAMVVYDREAALRRVGAEVGGFRESARPSPQRKLLQATPSFPAFADHDMRGLPEEEDAPSPSPREAGGLVSLEKEFVKRPVGLSLSRPPSHSSPHPDVRDDDIPATTDEWHATSEAHSFPTDADDETPLDSPIPPAYREVVELPWLAPVQASAASRAEPWGGWLVRSFADWGTWALDKAGEGIEYIFDSATDGISDVVASSPSYFSNASHPIQRHGSAGLLRPLNASVLDHGMAGSQSVGGAMAIPGPSSLGY